MEKNKGHHDSYSLRNYAEYSKGPLYVLGEKRCLSRPCLGIVGPRNPLMQTKKIIDVALRTMDLYTMTSISGGAQGIDQLVHEKSLEHGIPTVLVAGGGLRRLMRSTKRGLAKRILEQGGSIISQFGLDERPARWTFPQRNHLIALLSDGLFCPAAGQKSGSINTVNHMISLQKPVWTVPSNLREKTTAGTNKLLVDGAIRGLTNFHDMFSALTLRSKASKVLTPDELSLVALIESGVHHRDDLEQQSKCDASLLLLTLLQLENKGVICQHTHGQYVIIDSQQSMNNG